MTVVCDRWVWLTKILKATYFWGYKIPKILADFRLFCGKAYKVASITIFSQLSKSYSLVMHHWLKSNLTARRALLPAFCVMWVKPVALSFDHAWGETVSVPLSILSSYVAGTFCLFALSISVCVCVCVHAT